MEVILAETAGFCFGVKRAVDQVYEQIRTGKKIYTFGPIIHNENVVEDLEKKGDQVIEKVDELATLTEGSVVIRSHGVSKDVYELIQKQGLEIVDATCPFVKKIHRIVEKESKQGCQIIIIGNDSHPEVEGIKGWSGQQVTIISNVEDAEKFSLEHGKKICVVAQTTYNYNKFKELVEIISKKGYDIIVLNTICNATQERQEEAKEIAGQVDAMIVIGGSRSSNTQKLYEICKKECKNIVLKMYRFCKQKVKKRVDKLMIECYHKCN